MEPEWECVCGCVGGAGAGASVGAGPGQSEGKQSLSGSWLMCHEVPQTHHTHTILMADMAQWEKAGN